MTVGASPTEFGATPEIAALLRRPDTPQTHEITTWRDRVIELSSGRVVSDGPPVGGVAELADLHW